MDIYSMKLELYNYALQVQQEYLKNPSIKKHAVKYRTVSELYHKINSLNDEASIRAYLQEVFAMSTNLQPTYNGLLDKYNKATNNVLKSQYLTELNECGAKLNAYNETYNICSKYLSRKRETPSVSSIISKMTPIKKEEVKPSLPPETRPAVRRVYVDDGELINSDTITSDRIIALLERLNDIDKDSEEAKSILSEIYARRTQREEEFKKKYGATYRVAISELESYETMAAMMPSEGFKPRELDSNNFILELRSAINAVNEFHFMNELQIKKYYKRDNSLSDGVNFSKFYKKYNNYLRKFHVLLTSLFGRREVTFKVDGTDISTEDLLAYLGTCNLDGDFGVYKRKFNNTRIGTEDATKKKYNETLTFLNKCINNLCEMAKFKLNGNKVNVVDTEKTKADVIKQRNNRLKGLYNFSPDGIDGGIRYERK